MRSFLVIALSLAILQVAFTATLRPQVPDVVADDIYTFTDYATNLNLAIKDGAAEEGAFLTVAEPSASNTQRFLVKQSGENTYYISNINSALYLTHTADGVAQKPLEFSAHQEWTFTKTNDGNYLIQHKADKSSLQSFTKAGDKVPFVSNAVAHGFKLTHARVNENEDGNIDNYIINSATHTSEKKFANGIYSLWVIDNDDVISAEGGSVISAQYDDSKKEQQFKIELVEEGLYRLVSVSTGKAVATSGDKGQNGKALILVDVAKGDNKQLWHIRERDTDVWHLINKHSSLAAFTPFTNGEKVVQQPFVSARQQLFSIRAI